ncbi:MAG: hypothetical protein KatS3mg095_0646 [Candidatus Parcubacteria bacterium]|nr:MAG: hypothetical protein KatS3mg095_0646 [Candidatus Parcubacteria bacterium]
MKEKIKNLSKLFLEEAYAEIKKFKSGKQNRENTVWNIVNLAIKYELLSKEDIDKNIKKILELAMDLEVPDDIYKGDSDKDMGNLISLIKEVKEKH